MRTILQILERAGGYRSDLYLRIENPPYMALVIETRPAWSSGYLSSALRRTERRPDARHQYVFWDVLRVIQPLGMGWILTAFYFRNDYMGVEQYSCNREGDNYVFIPGLLREHESFAHRYKVSNMCFFLIEGCSAPSQSSTYVVFEQ
jgi:hypothetical protein